MANGSNEKVVEMQLVSTYAANPHPELKVKEYVPDKSAYSVRIPETQWETMRPILERLSKEGKSRPKMLKILAQKHSFYPSVAQLSARMLAWRYNVRKVACNQPLNVDVQPLFERVGLPLDADTAFIHTWLNRVEIEDPAEGCSKQSLPQSEYLESTFGLAKRAGDMLNMIREAVFAASEYTTYSTRSEESCIIHDIADFLLHSGSCPDYSYFLMVHLMDLVENGNIMTTPETRLVFFRDCLIWSREWKSPNVAHWVCQRFRKLLDEPTFHTDSTLRSYVFDCRRFAQKCYPLKDWWLDYPSREFSSIISPNSTVLGSSETFKCSLIENPVLSSVNDVVITEAGTRRNAYPINERMVSDLLTWCEREMSNFEWRPDVEMQQGISNGSQLTYYCWVESTRYLIWNWASYANALALGHFHRKTWHMGGHRPVSDFTLFKLTARALSVISSFVVERAKNFILARSLDSGQARQSQLYSDLAYALRTAISEMQLEYHLVLIGIYEDIPQRQDDSESNIMPGHLKEVLALVATELQRLRQDPSSRRHQEAYAHLSEPVQRLPLPVCPNGPDATLYDGRSTSSLRSFRRAGVKSKDRCGAPSMSGVSTPATRCSCDHSVPMIFE